MSATEAIGRSSDDSIDPIGRIAEEFIERLRRGEHPSIREFVERHPELADEIRDLFPTLAMVERFKPESSGTWVSASIAPTSGRCHIPDRLGDYRILRFVAEGGMGYVFEAEQISMDRRVALKVLKPHLADEKGLIQFALEYKLPGRLHYTNIIPVFGVGHDEGLHYYSMQFIHGDNLQKVIDDLRKFREVDHQETVTFVGKPPRESLASELSAGLRTGRYPPTEQEGKASDVVANDSSMSLSISNPSPPPIDRAADDEVSVDDSSSRLRRGGRSMKPYYREVARIGAQVARTLQFAHERGMLHHDIKPSNLLVDLRGVVWVADFGLARDEGALNIASRIAGTLRYMGKESLEGAPDARSDLYSLGVTLYELLTLRHAFEGCNAAMIIRQIYLGCPKRPREVDPTIPPDLEGIVLKAMAREPEDRFGSAEELAIALERYRDRMTPIHRPVSSREQFLNWSMRNPWLAGSGFAAALLMAMLALITSAAAWRFREQRNQIGRQRNTIAEASELVKRSDRDSRVKLFDALAAKARAGRFSHRVGQRFESLDALASAAEVGRALGLPPDQFETLRDEAVACLALPDVKPQGRRIHLPPDANVITFDARMTRYALRFFDGRIEVREAADDSPLAEWKSEAGGEIPIFRLSPHGRFLADCVRESYLKVWDLDRKAIAYQDPTRSVVHAFDFSPDGRHAALGHRDGRVVVLDLETGLSVSHLAGCQPDKMAFSPDGLCLAVIGDGRCHVIALDAGKPSRPFATPDTSRLAWSPDGTALATDGPNSKLQIWDVAAGVRRVSLEGATNGGLSPIFHPSGRMLVSHGWEGRLRFWDQATGKQLFNLDNRGSGPFFSPDGRTFTTVENEVTPYYVEPALEYTTLSYPSRELINYGSVSIRKDGRILALGTDRGFILWDLIRGRKLAFLPIGMAWHLRFDPSGDLLAGGDVGLRRWPILFDPAAGRLRIGAPGPQLLPPSNCHFAQDRTGRVLAMAHQSHCDVRTADRRFAIDPLPDCRSVSVSPDGEWLSTNFQKSGLKIWRQRDVRLAHELPAGGSKGSTFSPDGRWLMIEEPCRLLAVGSWREARKIGGEGLCFSDDGRLLAVQDSNKVVRLVDPETGRTLARLESPDLCGVGFACFSPDGSRLAISTNDGPAVHIWDLRAIRGHLAGMGLDWDAPPYADPVDGSATPPMEVEPADAVALAELVWGDTHLKKGEIDQAVGNFDRAIKLDPSLAPAFSARGDARVARGEVDRALLDFEEAIRIDPKLASAHDGRGRVHLLKRDRDRAAAEFNVAIELDAQYAPPHHGLGLVHGMGGQVDRAIAEFSEAIRLDPGHSGAYLRRGGAYLRRRDQDRAIADYEQALKLMPRYDALRRDLSSLCNDRAWALLNENGSGRDPGRALGLARRAVELSPEEPACLNTLGVALYRKGCLSEAIETLTRSLARRSGQGDELDLFFLAMAHHRSGRRAEARDFFDRAVRRQGRMTGPPRRQEQALAAAHAEAEAMLGVAVDLPDDVFAPDDP